MEKDYPAGLLLTRHPPRPLLPFVLGQGGRGFAGRVLGSAGLVAALFSPKDMWRPSPGFFPL
jgi:hypothetical protein